ncbi:MAG: REP-associated tyrosine transposase [Syntrophobacteraceae bacterium]
MEGCVKRSETHHLFGAYHVGWVKRSETHHIPDEHLLHAGSKMTNYRRNRLAGGTYFFTVAIAERHLDILVQHVHNLKAALRDEHQRAPFVNLGLVVLPDHLHTIWRLPQGDSDYSNRWRRIKAGFSRALPLGERVSASRTMNPHFVQARANTCDRCLTLARSVNANPNVVRVPLLVRTMSRLCGE